MKERRLFNDIWFTWPCEATTLVNVSANVQCCRSRGPFDGAQFQRWRGARWKWNDRRLSDRIGASVVLSSEMLSQVPAMTVAPLASEIDSLLLGEEHDNVAEECGDCAEGSVLSAGWGTSRTALGLNCQSLGSQLVHLVQLNLRKHILECFQLFCSCTGQHTYDTGKPADHDHSAGVPSPLWLTLCCYTMF